MKNIINFVKAHWTVILSALTSVYAILVNANVINTNNKTTSVVIAVVSTVIYTVFHIRLNTNVKP